MVPIETLQYGQLARIVSVRGQPSIVHYLKELGLNNNVEVRVFCSGNPCIIDLGGNRLCFRIDDTLRVFVDIT